MSDSVLELIAKASRPYKEFTVEINEEEFPLKVRRISSSQSAIITDAYNEELAKIQAEMENDSVDFNLIRHSLEKESKERLINFIIQSRNSEFLAQASTELDDLKINDDKVVDRAKQLADQEKSLLEGAPEEEIVEQAIRYRVDTYSESKAVAKRNRYLLYYSVSDSEGNPLAESADKISEVWDDETINKILFQALAVLGGIPDPLQSPPRKSTKRRSSSAKALEADQKG